ncbi:MULTISPECIES: DUF3131 domain-containing protein [Edwardsiella]|uniref:DUF3131 domain-containing protein n=2 Tax=Edwardsiella anguillarum TaxID=1821960 RepID=A0A076LYC7_9GAMM|nr:MULTISPECIES: DUF3131 domain-containing protein [Edwardsiella]AIJ10419.1 Hypothetical protein ETEE_4011 [Edwardsiella anguillarum ET080813]AKR77917.2 DUF3131 domain-containing protein [Edwardsiella sp. LADL05-105]KAB0586452.1 DUF3131 domain-containing protein [Edwardsiella anguillarum]UOU77607.1 DUF3131 domain-containing protein [Edwardsiella anguillarum]WHP82245.1 DUF3131 domain-containing protein [Edwardsiella anguillarum]
MSLPMPHPRSLLRLIGLLWLALLLILGGAAARAETILPAAGYPPRHGDLTPQEMAVAQKAWSYFVTNYQPATGLVNAANAYPSTTMWDTASYMAALTAARELGLVDKATFDQRMIKLLATLNNLDLFQGQAPNKAYNTLTAQKVNYINQPGEIGYSALDLGRMLIWLKIIKDRYPEYANDIDNLVLRWDFSHIIDPCGTLYGAVLDGKNQPLYVQEGRLGYEEYAAAGFQLWGFNTCQSSRAEPYQLADIYCVLVPYDARDPRPSQQHNYVTTEPYVLYGMELGWNKAGAARPADGKENHPWMHDFANRVYQAQENRYQIAGIVTARSEHQLDRAPYFVYDTVFSDGYDWNTITDKGVYTPEDAAVSLKAALGMWALWQSPYTDLLFSTIENANDAAKGFYEGLYENGSGPIREFTANNNGIMLEALLFKKQGSLFSAPAPAGGDGVAPSLWDKTLLNAFDESNRTHNRPYLSATPHQNSWCKQQGIALRAAPACPSCQCAACTLDAPIQLPPVSASCLKP